MKQITQDLKTGATCLVDVPLQKLRPGCLLIQTEYTLISAGTERMLVDFGKSSYLQKAKQQPDKVKEVFQKIKTDGLMTTVDAVKAKLAEPMPVGYCNVGRVIGVGVSGFAIGDLVASNGEHAEYVCVPKNLCAKVPEGVAAQAASFTVLASVALQSVRLIKPELGETIVVSGLGLVGLLAVQLLRSHGCRVIGADFNAQRLRLAEKFGATTVDLAKVDDPVSAIMACNDGVEVDAVLIAASTKSNDPVSQAAKVCRQRGRIILVGVTGLALSRADFYQKELTFQVSCSYGPGRYDANYEDDGHDYPKGFVRWTEQRNFEAVLQAMKEGWLQVDDLITNAFPVAEAEKAYQALLEDKSALGIVLSFPQQQLPDADAQNTMRTIELTTVAKTAHAHSVQDHCVQMSVIGAGNYASRMLIPAFNKAGVNFDTLYANTGLKCKSVATKFGFANASTHLEQLWSSDASQMVAIATRHNSHASLVCQSLSAQKHVFVEKPLAINVEEVEAVEQAYASQQGKYLLMVGFNRRFSPFVVKMKALLQKDPGPISMNMVINAGHIPAEHWTQDPKVGGGRIIGEACHFIDLARFIADSTIVDATINYLQQPGSITFDTAVISLQFANGSIASINYFANGHKSIPKERVEVFSKGRVLQLDNFRKLIGYGFSGFKKIRSFKQDKGQNQCTQAFVDAVQNGGPSPIPYEQIIEVAKVTMQLGSQ
jgi:predicted dehydrogenase